MFLVDFFIFLAYREVSKFWLYPTFDYTVKKISLKIVVSVLEVYVHKQSLKIQTYVCWKFKVGVRKNNFDNCKITAVV